MAFSTSFLQAHASGVNKALFDLKDSYLIGHLAPKSVDIGGWKGNTKEWGATALNYINTANGDAKKFSSLVEKMRFNSSGLGVFKTHSYLKQALKIEKDLKYNLKVIARNAFYSYRTGIYIPLGVSLKDQETAQKMLADVNVISQYLNKIKDTQGSNSVYSGYRNYNYYGYYASPYWPYYGLYGYGMYGYGGMMMMIQMQDYLMLENYIYALDREESLEHEARIDDAPRADDSSTPIDKNDDRDDKDSKDFKNDPKEDLANANVMGFYRNPKFSKDIQTHRLNHALVNLDNSHQLKDNPLFNTKALPSKSVDAITHEAKQLNGLVKEIQDLKAQGASQHKIDSVVDKAIDVRDKLDNNLSHLDNDLKNAPNDLSSSEKTQVHEAMESVQKLSDSSDTIGSYLDGSMKIDDEHDMMDNSNMLTNQAPLIVRPQHDRQANPINNANNQSHDSSNTLMNHANANNPPNNLDDTKDNSNNTTDTQDSSSNANDTDDSHNDSSDNDNSNDMNDNSDNADNTDSNDNNGDENPGGDDSTDTGDGGDMQDMNDMQDMQDMNDMNDMQDMMN
nr:dentin sialophosphopreproprotein [Helicobacter cetorum]